MVDDDLSLAIAAADIGVSVDQLAAAAIDGRLPARRDGDGWVTTRADLEAFQREFAADLQPPTDEAPLTEMDAEGEDGQLYGG